MDKNEFIKEVELLGIDCSSSKLQLLDRYYDLLIEWNNKINLTAIVDKKEVYLKHFYDSLTLARVISFDSIQSFCDIGTGAGFPGVVIKIFFPHLNVTLVDALNKRIKFLDVVCSELGLSDIELVHARAEEFALTHLDNYDVVCARAVASLNILLEYAIPMVKLNGCFVAMKGNDDLSLYENAFKKLSCKVDFVSSFYLPFEGSKRMLVRILKYGKTNKIYPRRYSEIKKKPL